MAVGGNGSVVDIWNTSTWKKAIRLQEHVKSVRQIEFSLDGKYLATGSFDKTIKIWDVRTWNVIKNLEYHNDYISAIKFSTDSKYLFSSAFNKELIVWKTSTWEKKEKIQSEKIISVFEFSNDNKLLLTGNWKNEIRENKFCQ